MRQLVLWCLLYMVSNAGLSQTNLAVHLNNLNDKAPAQLNAGREAAAWPTNNCHDGRCFAVLQFKDLPTTDQVLILRELGIQLYDYIPRRAFLASRAESRSGRLPDFVRRLLPLAPENKQPQGAALHRFPAGAGDTLQLLAQPFPGIQPSALAEALAALGAVITQIGDDRVHFRLPASQVAAALACPRLQYLEPQAQRPRPEGRQSRTNGRVYQANQGPDSGYDGQGVAIAIADDGAVHHLDFLGRVVNHTQINTGSHAEMTAGMALGAGTIQPLAMGMAPAATLHLYDIMGYEHIQQAPANYTNHGVVITSTSFSEGCGDPYNLPTRDIDQQVFTHPYLTHCFSVGNFAENPCPNNYGALGLAPQGFYYSTITGGRKAGKNVIAVGNTNWLDELRYTSSRGPAYDGRLKPDLVALGQGDLAPDEGNDYRLSSGTSAAAPAVAGAMATLYQFYRETHGGQDPNSALLKAAVLNTAEDLGPAGPDYSHGWGRLDLGRALDLLRQERYFGGQLFHGAQGFHNVEIPDGVSRVKVMLYWHDPAGSLLTPQALVNDLDLRLAPPNGPDLPPWSPSSAYNLDSLGAPAKARPDHLNNVEQVVLDNPAPGAYTIKVNGFEVPLGSQPYVVVYQFEFANTRLVYPAEGTEMVPFEEDLIRWEAAETELPFSVAVSLDGMTSWQTLATGLPGTERSLNWTPPQHITDQAYFRLIHGADTLTSGPAVISPLPFLTVSHHSAGQAELSWEPIPGATAYEVLMLGASQLEPLGVTAASSYLAPVTLGEEYWFSVRPLFPSGRAGRRATAVHYQHFGCSQQVNLRIHFDQYPGETSWRMLGSEGNIILSGGPYTDAAPHSEITIPICLPAGCHTLVMLDNYGDGICCGNGEGWYALYNNQGQLLGSGSEFGSWTYHTFCPNGSPDPLQLNTQFLHPVSCFGGQDGAAQMEAAGGSGIYTYQWSNGATGPGQSGLVAGTYGVTLTDGIQSVSSTVTITQPPPLQLQTSVDTAYCQDGALTVTAAGGTAPYTINWADGYQEWSRGDLPAGAFFVMVHDVKGCLQTATPVVPLGPPLRGTAVLTAPTCAQTPTGAVAVTGQGGHADYQWQWSTGATGPLLDGVPAGQYTYTLTDGGGCQYQETVTLAEPNPIVVHTLPQHPLCANSLNGAIQTEVSGGIPPYNFSWSTGATQANLTGLGAGWYALTVTDQQGCERATSLPLIAPDALQAGSQVSPASPAAAGTASLTIQGGTPPYQVFWDHGPSSFNLDDLAPGIYPFTVLDQHFCFFNGNVEIGWNPTVSPPPPPSGYCNAQGSSTSYEWIHSVRVGNAVHTSGNDLGYGNHTDVTFDVQAGSTTSVTLTPQYTGTAFGEHWRVWADWNRDGDFDDPHELSISAGPLSGSFSTNMTIPPGAALGLTRLRVAMQYGTPPSLCQNLAYGEVEDYLLHVTASMGLGQTRQGTTATADATAGWTVHPNPTHDWFTLSALTPEGEFQWWLMDGQGRRLSSGRWYAPGGAFRERLSLEGLPAGLYFLRMKQAEQTHTLRVVKW